MEDCKIAEWRAHVQKDYPVEKPPVDLSLRLHLTISTDHMPLYSYTHQECGHAAFCRETFSRTPLFCFQGDKNVNGKIRLGKFLKLFNLWATNALSQLRTCWLPLPVQHCFSFCPILFKLAHFVSRNTRQKVLAPIGVFIPCGKCINLFVLTET